MKKNKMMRIASFLLVAVLLSTSVISGTFAKYVTSDSVADSARVAKFGVVVTATGSLFERSYTTADANAATDGDTDGLSVVSSNEQDVVAPGTGNANGLDISVTGQPEVDVRVNFTFGEWDEDVFLAAKTGLPDMTTGNATDTFANDAVYYPVVYTLTKGGQTVATGNLETIKNYITANYAGYYNANENLTEKIGALKLTWDWAFDQGKDKQDTLLGDLAAGIGLTPATTLVDGTDYNLDAKLNITVTVTQVD